MRDFIQNTSNDNNKSSLYALLEKCILRNVIYENEPSSQDTFQKLVLIGGGERAFTVFVINLTVII